MFVARRVLTVATTCIASLRLVAALAAVLVAVAYVAESSPARTGWGPQGATREPFVSQLYGYEIVLTSAWYASYPSDEWTGGFPEGASGQVDVITDPGDHKFIVGANRVPAGMKLRKWEATRIAAMQSVCKKATAFRNTTLGGVAAREFTLICPGYDVITVVALHRNRGYLVAFLTPNKPLAKTATPDRRIYEPGRRSIRFVGN